MGLEVFTEKDITELLSWLDGSDERFLYQFSGPKYSFPLDRDQLIGTIEGSEYIPFKFIVDGRVVGHCHFARLNIQERHVTLGRLLINPTFRGKGYGARMIEEMIEYGKSTYGLDTFYLVVFDFNKSAIKCYENSGFSFKSSEQRFIEKFNESWNCITMECKC